MMILLFDASLPKVKRAIQEKLTLAVERVSFINGSFDADVNKIWPIYSSLPVPVKAIILELHT